MKGGLRMTSSEKALNNINKLDHTISKLKIKIEKLNNKKEKNYLVQYKLKKYIDKLDYCNSLLQSFLTKSYEDACVDKVILKEKKQREQILYGSITKTILMICLPLAIYALFNSFYNLIDAMMASKIKDAASASGAINVSNVAIISQVKSMISAFGAGIAGGGAVLVSRYYGAGKIKDAQKTASNMTFVSLITSIIIIVLLVPLASVILKIAQVPIITADVVLYFRLILFELVLVSINSIFIGLEKIKGNSKKIFGLNIIVLIIKMVLNLTFVFGMKVDTIIYLEIATIVSQFSLFIYGVIIMLSKKNMLQISIKYMKPEAYYIVPILKLSLPIFLGKFVMSLGKTTVNAICGAYYSTATDGLITGALGVSNNLSGIVTNTTNVFEEGESTIVSQNIGNKNIKRTLQTFFKTLIMVAVISAIGFILVRFIFLDELVSLFNNSEDESNMMSVYIKDIFVYDSLSIPALGLASALLGLLYGYGKTFLSTILNFSRIGIRIITLIICHSAGMGHEAAGVSMGISNILIGILSLIFLLIFLLNLKKNGYDGIGVDNHSIEA